MFREVAGSSELPSPAKKDQGTEQCGIEDQGEERRCQFKSELRYCCR